MDVMIGYCGLACRSCPIHLATLEPDDSKRRTMRASIARVCSEQYGLTLLPEDVSDCDGCRSDTGRLFSGCARCEIRSCAIKRKLESCAFCDEYACDKLRSHFEMDPTAEARLQVLRSQK
ncbi:MAG: DUF3795 domain-containing protein [Acidobacteriia bacterium]|nr:DUF3795 domain-containing protein [Terriglobia bacterium]